MQECNPISWCSFYLLVYPKRRPACNWDARASRDQCILHSNTLRLLFLQGSRAGTARLWPYKLAQPIRRTKQHPVQKPTNKQDLEGMQAHTFSSMQPALASARIGPMSVFF